MDHRGQNLIASFFYDLEQIQSVIFNESSIDESESEIFHKSINTNKEKDTIYETEDEETLVTDNPVINEPRYFNIFECGKNLLNKLDAKRKQECTATSKDKYYRENFNTLTYYNESKNTPFPREYLRRNM